MLAGYRYGNVAGVVLRKEVVSSPQSQASRRHSITHPGLIR